MWITLKLLLEVVRLVWECKIIDYFEGEILNNEDFNQTLHVFYFNLTIFSMFLFQFYYILNVFYFSFTIFSMFLVSVLLYVSMFIYFRTFLYISITIVLGTTCARPYLQADYMISEKVTHSPISAIHMAGHGHSTDLCI